MVIQNKYFFKSISLLIQTRNMFFQLYFTHENILWVCPVLIKSGALSMSTGYKTSDAHSGLQASEACRNAGGTRAAHKEDGFIELIIRPQGTMISCKMALKDGTQKITRERQMDGMSNNQEEICTIMSVRELVDRILKEN
jgi:hypothetical protein